MGHFVSTELIIGAVVLALLVVFGVWWSRSRSKPVGRVEPTIGLQPVIEPRPSSVPTISLEKQIADLRQAGLALNAGIGVDDFLVSFPRSEFEELPYNLLLIMCGFEIEREPLGRRFSDCAWSLDMECVDGPGSYVRIVNELAALTGGGLVRDVSDDINFRRTSGSVSYTIAGKRKTLPVRIDNDWADPDAVAAILSDLEVATNDGRRFCGVENGQSTTYFFIREDVVARVNALAGSELILPASWD